MTQQNHNSASPKTSRKGFKWAFWIPYPTSWLKAFILAVILPVVTYLIGVQDRTGSSIVYISKSINILIISGLISLLSPIAIISFIHHFFHLFVGNLIPSIQAPEVGKVKGFTPKLISWWEGLYGWLVIVLSTLIASCLIFIFVPESIVFESRIYHQVSTANQLITSAFATLWTINAALLYQFEYLFKRHLIKSYSNPPNLRIDTKYKI
jgi:hypothetical protein